MTKSDIEWNALEQRVKELEAENAQLREAMGEQTIRDRGPLSRQIYLERRVAALEAELRVQLEILKQSTSAEARARETSIRRVLEDSA